MARVFVAVARLLDGVDAKTRNQILSCLIDVYGVLEAVAGSEPLTGEEVARDFAELVTLFNQRSRAERARLFEEVIDKYKLDITPRVH
jgi:hypothetical protein